MTMPHTMKDLVVLAADKQMQRTIEALLADRRGALRIADITVDVLRHPQKDSGCRTASDMLLAPSRNRYRKAVAIFDYHGSGEKNLRPEDLEYSLEQRYESRGWGPDTVVFVIIDPELESWLFGAPFQRIEHAIGWSQATSLQDWMVSRRHLSQGEIKPQDPQAAIDAALRLQKKPRTSKIFTDLARTVSLARCQDRAFQKFLATLQRWFPAQ